MLSVQTGVTAGHLEHIRQIRIGDDDYEKGIFNIIRVNVGGARRDILQ